MIDKLSLTAKADNTTQRKEMSGRVLRLVITRKNSVTAQYDPYLHLLLEADS